MPTTAKKYFGGWKHNQGCGDANIGEVILQKLNYIHLNPTKGVNPLVLNPSDYSLCSAKFYILAEQSEYEVFHYAKLQDIDLTNIL